MVNFVSSFAFVIEIQNAYNFKVLHSTFLTLSHHLFTRLFYITIPKISEHKILLITELVYS